MQTITHDEYYQLQLTMLWGLGLISEDKNEHQYNDGVADTIVEIAIKTLNQYGFNFFRHELKTELRLRSAVYCYEPLAKVRGELNERLRGFLNRRGVQIILFSA